VGRCRDNEGRPTRYFSAGRRHRCGALGLYLRADTEDDDEASFVVSVAVVNVGFTLIVDFFNFAPFCFVECRAFMALYSALASGLGFTVFFSTRCCWAAAVEGESARGAVVMTAASAILENALNMSGGLANIGGLCGEDGKLGLLSAVGGRSQVRAPFREPKTPRYGPRQWSPHAAGIAEGVETDGQQGDGVALRPRRLRQIKDRLAHVGDLVAADQCAVLGRDGVAYRVGAK